jgi:YD repeat-containing protein
LLIAIADVTMSERDALGVPLSICGPFGQVTQLQVNPEGYLSRITNPAGETVSLGYGDEDLLTSFTDALNRTHAFVYDAAGVLVQDTNPAGGGKTLTRTTPAGRHLTTRLDDRGRVVQIEVPGILPVQLTYDVHGRLEMTAQGGRTSTSTALERG